MINVEETAALDKWIKEWKKTYSESPSLDECCTWFEWQFKNKYLSESDKKTIKAILVWNC